MTVGKDLRRQAQRRVVPGNYNNSAASTAQTTKPRRECPFGPRADLLSPQACLYSRAATGSEVYDSAQAGAIMIKSVGGLGCMEG